MSLLTFLSRSRAQLSHSWIPGFLAHGNEVRQQMAIIFYVLQVIFHEVID